MTVFQAFLELGKLCFAGHSDDEVTMEERGRCVSIHPGGPGEVVFDWVTTEERSRLDGCG